MAAEEKPAGAEAEAEVDNCVFCLEPTSQQCIARPCGHACFDFVCLASWLLEYHATCPLCKSHVSTVAYGDDLACVLDINKESHKRKAASVARAGRGSAARSRSYQQRSRIASAGPTPEDEALEERRRVYRLGLYARHIGSNGRSRHYQDLTPRMFQQDPDLTSRARAFIRRELQVLWREQGPVPARAPPLRRGPFGLFTRQRAGRNRHQLIEYIVLILKSLDIQSNGNGIDEMLARDLSSASVVRHFLHELRCFLRSPYLTVAAWDRHVQYGRFGDAVGAEESGNDSELDTQDALRADTAQREEWFQPRLYLGGTRARYLG